MSALRIGRIRVRHALDSGERAPRPGETPAVCALAILVEQLEVVDGRGWRSRGDRRGALAVARAGSSDATLASPPGARF